MEEEKKNKSLPVYDENKSLLMKIWLKSLFVYPTLMYVLKLLEKERMETRKKAGF